jgi:hypothetical protein
MQQLQRFSYELHGKLKYVGERVAGLDREHVDGDVRRTNP